MSLMLRPLLVLFVLLTVLTGLVYPLAVTGIGRAVFPNQVSGSLVMRDGKAVGSSLIGQSFQEPKYFWGRIDALKAADPDNSLPIPVDLVTASASGVDPHVSPAAALYQVGRVARAR